MSQDLNIITLRSGDYSCEIISNYGACLNSYKYKERDFISGYSSRNDISSQQYKGVLLAPFPNRVAEAKFSFDGQSYLLLINREKESLALHGFLYNRDFAIKIHSEDSLVLQYKYLGDAAGYPFSFDITIEYGLHKDGLLSINTQFKNTGNQSLPYGLGWHPYFQMGKNIDELHLSFPPCKLLDLDDKLIPTGNLTVFAARRKNLKLADYNFDSCFFIEPENEASFTLSDDQTDLIIRANGFRDYPYFQIYTAKDRQSIAIEPMTCAPNAFNNNMGLGILLPNESSDFKFHIQALAKKV